MHAERGILKSEICLIYPEISDPKKMVKKAIELVQGDFDNFHTVAFPGNILAPHAGIFLNEAVIGNFPMEIFAVLLLHKAELQRRVRVVAMEEISEDFVARLVAAAKTANVDPAGSIFNRHSVASEIFQVAVVLLLALTGGLATETRKTLGAVYGVPGLTGEDGEFFGDFFGNLVQRELRSEYANYGASELATLVFSMRPVPEVSVTIDSWINCDLCQKWRILTADWKHLEDKDTFKCSDLPGLSCAVVCDTLRFTASA